jgi:hypothetical protein
MGKNKAIASIADMREMARHRGGKCLSERYITLKTKMVWQCEKGHIWEARPLNIRKGNWCPICARVSQRLWNRQTPRQH